MGRHCGPTPWADSLRTVHLTFTADHARQWAVLTRAALAARRTELDALNVYPVPDGDTGTNLHLTLDGAIEQVVEAHAPTRHPRRRHARPGMHQSGRATLLSARGNSGVILSQILRGLTQVVVERDLEEVDAPAMADCFRTWRSLAQGCRPPAGGNDPVGRRRRRASRTGRRRCQGLDRRVAEAARDAASAALLRTPEQLPALAAAGWSTPAGPGACSWRRCAASSRATGPRPTCSVSRRGPPAAVATDGPRRPQADRHRRRRPARRRCTGHLVPSRGGPGRPGLRGDVPRRGQRQTSIDALTATLDRLGTRSSSAAPTCGASHVHVDDVGATIGRASTLVDCAHPGDQLRRPDRPSPRTLWPWGSSPARRGRASPPSSGRAAQSSSTRSPAPEPPPDNSSMPPNTWRPRRPHPPQRQGTPCSRPGTVTAVAPRDPLLTSSPPAPQWAWPRWPCSTNRLRQDNVVAMAGAAGRPGTAP